MSLKLACGRMQVLQMPSTLYFRKMKYAERSTENATLQVGIRVAQDSGDVFREPPLLIRTAL
ncbi:hypothetical protein D6029_03970 [Buttiauxella izardii]|uniref:Uncharacterized protein n=1 Tax=Buttiauxella izardii TaxID=82991 RepID=A0A3A5JV81_9ENTR|nr:hypothetical protein D6029_03970 [Buttiauxella izardii]